MAAKYSEKVFRLKWDNHLQNLSCLFDSLFIQQKYVDVTLCCNGGSLKAHKVVLSACSPYFETIFRDHPCKHPVVVMHDVKSSEMQMLLEYMYKGELNVLEEELSSFVDTAALLDVRGLSNNLPKVKETASEELPVTIEESSGLEILPVHSNPATSRPTVNSIQMTELSSDEPPDSSAEEQHLEAADILAITNSDLEVIGLGPVPKSDRPVRDSRIRAQKRVADAIEVLTGRDEKRNRNMMREEAPVFPSHLTYDEPVEIVQIKQDPESNSQQPEIEEEDKTSMMNLQTECSLCKISFPTPLILHSHLQEIHNYTEDYRPHRCEFCPLAFYRSAHLKRHRRLHTGERPYSCHLCNKCFSRQDKLKQHISRHGAFGAATMPTPPAPISPKGRQGPGRSRNSNPRNRPSRPPNPDQLPFGDMSFLSSLTLAPRDTQTSAEQLLRSVEDLGECIIQPCLPNRSTLY